VIRPKSHDFGYSLSVDPVSKCICELLDQENKAGLARNSEREQSSVE